MCTGLCLFFNKPILKILVIIPKLASRDAFTLAFQAEYDDDRVHIVCISNPAH